MKELEILLERFWIIKEQDKELYYRVKDASPRFKNFLEEKLGYQLIITPYFVKLEKLPGKAEAWMGINQFDQPMEYAFLCLLFVFLEDKGPEEQFVLSQVTEFIQGMYPGEEKVDWTLYSHRRSLIKMMRFAGEMYLIRLDDGSDQDFTNTSEAEVLYENTGLSRYFVRNFTGNILNYDSWQDIENGEWLEADRDRGRVRRNRVYRRIFMAPAVYAEGVDDPDYLYIRTYRNILQKDVEDILDSQLHIHKNGAFLVLDESKNFKEVFPDNKNISEIVLQFNGIVVDMLEKQELDKSENDVITVSMSKFESLVELCRSRYIEGWIKEYREMKPSKLYKEVLDYMKSYSMVEVDEILKEIKIMPMAGKVIGKYPDDFKGARQDMEDINDA